jgi:hypothetical protein
MFKKVLFTLFPKFFTIQKVYGQCEEGTYKLALIEPDSDSIVESLGIQDERVDEIIKFCRECYNESDKLTEAADKAFRRCVHPNELFFATSVLDQMHEKNLNPLSSFIKKL